MWATLQWTHMSVMVSLITGILTVCQQLILVKISVLLVLCEQNPLVIFCKGPVMGKAFPCHNVVMSHAHVLAIGSRTDLHPDSSIVSSDHYFEGQPLRITVPARLTSSGSLQMHFVSNSSCISSHNEITNKKQCENRPRSPSSDQLPLQFTYQRKIFGREPPGLIWLCLTTSEYLGLVSTSPS